MTGRLRLEVAPELGALQRVLVTLTRRGYDALRVDARRDSGAMRVELEVEGQRPVAWLAPHLERLFDVRRVEVVPSPAE